jgi:hypothetical protein
VAKAQKSSSGFAGLIAQPVFIRFLTGGVNPEMTFLYLVVMVAANTKYSINSSFTPVLFVVFGSNSQSA